MACRSHTIVALLTPECPLICLPPIELKTSELHGLSTGMIRRLLMLACVLQEEKRSEAGNLGA